MTRTKSRLGKNTEHHSQCLMIKFVFAFQRHARAVCVFCYVHHFLCIQEEWRRNIADTTARLRYYKRRKTPGHKSFARMLFSFICVAATICVSWPFSLTLMMLWYYFTRRRIAWWVVMHFIWVLNSIAFSAHILADCILVRITCIYERW